MKNRDTYWRRYKIQETLYIVPFKVGTLGPHTILPISISCPIIFSWISSTVWNLFAFKGDSSFGKNRKFQGAKSGLGGGELSHLGDLMFHKKNSAEDVMREWEYCRDKVASHQLPIAVAFWTIQIVSQGMFKLNAKFDADSLLYLLSHFECHGHAVHILTQKCLPPPLTSTVKSSLFTHVHSSPLVLAARLYWGHANCSHCINNGWTFPRQTLHASITMQS